MKLYLAGSLRNPRIPVIGNRLRQEGFDVFDDWFAGGKIADDEWQAYETIRGHSYIEGLRGEAARHVFEFDFKHIQASDAMVIVAPCGKSTHLELGWVLGTGRPGWVLLEQSPDRWDVMLRWATGVFSDIESLCQAIKEHT